MKVQQFLQHYGLTCNPFGDEDAQTDPVFNQLCLHSTHHPAWDKISGSPNMPATAVVFGEKGSGKTAMRLQMAARFDEYNRQNPERRVFVIEYDDLNPLLDRFQERSRGRSSSLKDAKVLNQWRLTDHIDSILTLGVSRLVNDLLNPPAADAVKPAGDGNGCAGPKAEGTASAIDPDRLNRLAQPLRRDLLLLTAFYEQSPQMSFPQRWAQLRRRLKYNTLAAQWDWWLGLVGSLGLFATLLSISTTRAWLWPASGSSLPTLGILLVILAFWMPWAWRWLRMTGLARRIAADLRVVDRRPSDLRAVLAQFPQRDLAYQPMPTGLRSDERYELLVKLQEVLKAFGYASIIVLVDRVDEPHLINGAPERMRDFLWSIFDNKLLKHPGIGFKLLLPSELMVYIQRAEREFYERSRLDKQNMVPALQWSGHLLYDIANERLNACRQNQGEPANGRLVVRELFDPSISTESLINDLERLRVPRHLFKFMHRLIIKHCERYTEDDPHWQIDPETFRSTFALYQRDLDSFDRGVGTG